MYVYLFAAEMKHWFIAFLIWNILVCSRIVLGSSSISFVCTPPYNQKGGPTYFYPQ